MNMRRLFLLFIFILLNPATGFGGQACHALFTFVSAKPRLFIVSAPSGAGKTTLIKKLISEFPRDFAVSVSTTTRAPRTGEIDGVDYHFTSVADFRRRVSDGEFAEWAEVHGNFYGTSKIQIHNHLNRGTSVFLNINVEGAANFRKTFPGRTEGIFISPPSLEILEQRLRSRGTESEENIQKRLRNARDEIEQAPDFENIIINDELDRAYEDFRRVVRRDP